MIAGGKAMAREKVQCQYLGNEAETKTLIYCGVDFYLLEECERIQKKAKDLKQYKEQLLENHAWLKTWEKDKSFLPAEERKMLLALEERLKIVQEKSLEMEERIHILKKSAYGYESPRVVIEKMVYQGTLLKLGHVQHKVKETLSGRRTFI